MKIKQKHYHPVEIDNREKDIVMIWGYNSPISTEVLQIERKNLPQLISMLQECAKGPDKHK